MAHATPAGRRVAPAQVVAETTAPTSYSYASRPTPSTWSHAKSSWPEHPTWRKARLESLLGGQGALADLNRLLADRIAAGAIDRATPELLDHLRATTLAKLAVDQPSYSGYLTALDGAQAKDI